MSIEKHGGRDVRHSDKVGLGQIHLRPWSATLFHILALAAKEGKTKAFAFGGKEDGGAFPAILSAYAQNEGEGRKRDVLRQWAYLLLRPSQRSWGMI